MTVAGGRPFGAKPDKILVDRAALKQVLMWAEALALLGNIYVELGEGGPHPDNLENIEKDIDEIKKDLKEVNNRTKAPVFGRLERYDDHQSDECNSFPIEILGAILPAEVYSHITGTDRP